MARRKRRNAGQSRRGYQAGGERLDSRTLLSGITAFVTTTADSNNQGTLRFAIAQIDSSGSPSSENSIVFEIPKTDAGYNPGTGTFTISPQHELPPITSPAFVDGTSESAFLGEPALVVIDGKLLKNADGLTLAPSAPGSTIDGLEIANFDGSGIVIQSSNNTIGGPAAGAGNILASNSTAGISFPVSAVAPLQGMNNLVLGNFIGTDPSGAQLGNGAGVISNTSGNTIGGITAGAANVIGFNTSEGILLAGLSASQNVVLGNSIGTNASGANLGNPIGITIQTMNNTIGGASAGAANVIGFASSEGILIDGGTPNGGPGASGNVVLGNFIGTNAAGTNLSNAIGLNINSAGNTIGGVTANAGNVISFNTTAGVQITGAGASGNVLFGNLLGTDSSGEHALGNGIGVLISSGTDNSIGGTMAGSGNIISGNFTAGIELSSGSVSATQILGNRIGTDPSGTHAVTRADLADPLSALQNTGVAIIGSAGNTVGGSSLQAGNLISGNYVGLMLADIAGSGSPNLVLGNLIGTDVSGSKALGNIVGIYVNSAAGNQIGGTAAGTANIVSGNSSVGVEIYGSGSTANVVQGDVIGLAADGHTALQKKNGQFAQSTGVFIQNASGNLIGGTSAGAADVISGNQVAGVYIHSHAGVSSGNVVNGNLIGRASGGGRGPGNNGYGVLLLDSPRNEVSLTGPARNRFGRNSFGNFRRLSGSAGPTKVTAANGRADRTAATNDSHQTATRPAGPVHQLRRKPGRGA